MEARKRRCEVNLHPRLDASSHADGMAGRGRWKPWPTARALRAHLHTGTDGLFVLGAMQRLQGACMFGPAAPKAGPQAKRPGSRRSQWAAGNASRISPSSSSGHPHAAREDEGECTIPMQGKDYHADTAASTNQALLSGGLERDERSRRARNAASRVSLPLIARAGEARSG